MGALGDYAQTPKASTFHVANAPNRDALAAAFAHFRWCGGELSSTWFSCINVADNEQPSHFCAPFTPATDFTDGNPRAGVLAPWKRPCRLLWHVCPSAYVPLCIVVCRFLKFASARLSLVDLCMPILPCPHTSHEKCQCIPMCTGPLSASVTLLS